MSSIEEVKHLQIPLQELSDATNGFSKQNLIARGGLGNVYKGVSEKHGTMAIKMLDHLQGQGNNEFKKEIDILSAYKHQNIASLVGFCDKDGQMMLVYKYESNGSLDKHLSSADLNWIQRLQICLDAASGLQFIHDDVGLQHRILHRDVKSANILLDEKWKAKISDFGLCREGPANMQSSILSDSCGTFGYIDPDYYMTGYLTQKSDVYSFGVVLWEVLCGRLTRDLKYRDKHEFLTTLVKIHWERNTIYEIIHPDLQKQIKTPSLLTFSGIAYQCLMSGNERPMMKKVVEQLQKALNNQLIHVTLNSKFMPSIEEAKHLQIPLQELSDASNGFSKQNLIARGGFGNVYKGVSEKHGTMAIKMLDCQLGQGDKEFKTEIDILSAYKHENIASLVGFCDEDGQKMLVYKYESNGSLDKHLSSTDLNWIPRLLICLDAARGLQYLHDGVGLQHRILHRDVKSANILLDENWKAKISDFGLCREAPANMQSTFLISNGCGTIGYIDPDYLMTGYLTQKSDVYSFGVVLFEVLCGRLARDRKYRDKHDFLTTLVKIHWERKAIYEIIHPELRKQIKTESFLTFSSIAYQCLMSGNERPTMKKVVEQLQKALDNQLAPSGSLSDDGDSSVHIGGQTGLLASSSQSRPASSSRTWKYDVFLSFSGEDARNSFVDILYMALENREIITYMDDKQLPMEESIVTSLHKAIQESRIAIVIFSLYYARSTWCLRELALIMKNMDERGQIVIPIFYDVKPSEVRNLTGYYGEVFSRHELKNNNKVESWRKAIARAADLSGWNSHAMARGDELKLINRICDDISYKLKTHSEASASTWHIGIETRMQELKSLLEVGSGGVHMIGICGMWGSGKSTLASSIYEQINLEFEACCFVENVRAESRMHGLKTLQEKILSDVLNSKVKLRSIEEGISMMSTRLCQNSVLIVLDDVDHIDHLKMLAGSKNWFGNGSRIIITTRKQRLAKTGGFLTHNVRMLDAKEAVELFKRHAFGESKPLQGFEDVSLNIVSKLGGHPSALISLGSFLNGKGMSEWMDILDRLDTIPVDEILTNFKVGNDGIVRDISDWLLN